MARNKVSDLRDHLFASIEALRDADPKDLEREIARARAVSGVAQVIIESAKVEVDLVSAVGASGLGTNFMSLPPEESRELPRLVSGEREAVNCACGALSEGWPDNMCQNCWEAYCDREWWAQWNCAFWEHWFTRALKGELA